MWSGKDKRAVIAFCSDLKASPDSLSRNSNIKPQLLAVAAAAPDDDKSFASNHHHKLDPPVPKNGVIENSVLKVQAVC